MAIATVAETHRLLRAYRQQKDASARDQLVVNYIPLVRRLCGRFGRSRESQEDLFQVGVIGLLNAIDRFDPSRGYNFSSLGIPEVLGAILNHLRDRSSLIKPPRPLRRKRLTVERTSERMAVRLGRWPTVAELALECGLPVEDVRAAQGLANAAEPRSLDERLNTGDADEWVTLSDFLGSDDDRFDRALDRFALAAALNGLPGREKKIVTLRYYKGLTQKETAQRVGVSQMHVSRLERGALLKLRLLVQPLASQLAAAS